MVLSKHKNNFHENGRGLNAPHSHENPQKWEIWSFSWSCSFKPLPNWPELFLCFESTINRQLCSCRYSKYLKTFSNFTRAAPRYNSSKWSEISWIYTSPTFIQSSLHLEYHSGVQKTLLIFILNPWSALYYSWNSLYALEHSIL